MPFVPQFAVRLTSAIPHTHVCLCCDHPVLAASEHAAFAAMDAHARYVNAHADKATDPHFDEVRLDQLLGP